MKNNIYIYTQLLKEKIHKDNYFLIDSYLDNFKYLDMDIINYSFKNGYAFNFCFADEQLLYMPKNINVNFKYFIHLKNYDEKYWEYLMDSWKKMGVDGDIFSGDDLIKLSSHHDSFIKNINYLPDLILEDDNFFIFKNYFNKPKPELNSKTLSMYKQLKTDVIKLLGTDFIKFPIHDLNYYRIVDDKLILWLPNWCSFRFADKSPDFVYIDIKQRVGVEKDSKIVEVQTYNPDTILEIKG